MSGTTSCTVDGCPCNAEPVYSELLEVKPDRRLDWIFAAVILNTVAIVLGFLLLLPR